MGPIQGPPGPISPLSDEEKAKRDKLLARLSDNPDGPPLTEDELKLVLREWNLTGGTDASLQASCDLVGQALRKTLASLPLELDTRVISAVSSEGPRPASSPIGGSGSYMHSGYSGYSSLGSFPRYSGPLSSGPSGGVLFVAGVVVLGVLAALLYGGWQLVKWIF